MGQDLTGNSNRTNMGIITHLSNAPQSTSRQFEGGDAPADATNDHDRASQAKSVRQPGVDIEQVRELILECIEDFKLDFEEQIDDKILDAIDLSKLNLFES